MTHQTPGIALRSGELSDAERRRIDAVLSAGLCTGIGDGTLGNMCIEAAINCALGGDALSDKIPCVHAADRAMVVWLNDAFTGTPAERSAALAPLVLPHLGTAGADRTKIVRSLVLETIRRVLPIALRASNLSEHAVACEKAENLAAAHYAAAAADAAARATARADAAAHYAARAAATARAAHYAAHYAARAAAAADYAADYAADAAADAADYAHYAARPHAWQAFFDAVILAYVADGRLPSDSPAAMAAAERGPK